jgi:hypothetical protein
MFRMICTIGVTALMVVLSAEAGPWYLDDILLIDEIGTHPSLWNGSVAYTLGHGGELMFYDGAEPIHVYGPDTNCYEPQNAGSAVGWRNYVPTESRNDIYRWDGDTVTNISASPSIDSDLAAGGNGDLLWSRNHEWLWYYDAATDSALPLGVKGVHPTLYITEAGVATYAYQDPDTNEVLYFDGNTTHVLGAGFAYGAYPTLWDGAVAWIGTGEGSYFTATELFYWKDGEAQRLTNDDDDGGIEDGSPSLWNDLLVWTRYPEGEFAPRLYLWDGSSMTELSSTGGEYPSLYAGQVAWVDNDGLYLASLYLRGDLDGDGDVDLSDLAQLLAAYGACLGDPDYDPAADLDDSGCVNLSDLATLLSNYGAGT